MKENYTDLNILDETEKLLLGYKFEDVYLVDKSNGAELLYDSFYGDPHCGLISSTNEWAVIGGEHLTLWRKGKTEVINKEEIKWIKAIRQTTEFMIELLVDPWGSNASIWQVDMRKGRIEKIRDFKEYQDKEYTEDIVW